nr:hypothetical protein [Paludisphaera soli]
MKVEHQAPRIAVGNPGAFQVGPEHARAPVVGQSKDGFPGGHGRDVRPQVARQVVGKDHRGGFAVLGVPGRDDHGGRVRSPVEGFGPDALNLAVPQPGRDGQPVAERPLGAGRVPPGGAGAGGFDQVPQFIDADGPPIVATVFLGVVARYVRKRVGRQPARLPGPRRERTRGRPVAVDGPQGQTILAQGLQGILDAIGRQVRQPGRGGQREHAAGLARHQGDVLGSRPLRGQMGAVRFQVFGDRPGGVILPREVARVDQSRLDLRGLGLGGAGQVLRRPLVGASLPFDPPSVGIDVGEVPSLPAFS